MVSHSTCAQYQGGSPCSVLRELCRGVTHRGLNKLWKRVGFLISGANRDDVVRVRVLLREHRPVVAKSASDIPELPRYVGQRALIKYFRRKWIFPLKRIKTFSPPSPSDNRLTATRCCYSSLRLRLHTLFSFIAVSRRGERVALASYMCISRVENVLSMRTSIIEAKRF